MAITKEKKKQIIDALAKGLKDSESVVFVNFHGISVNDANALRKELRNEGINYMVAKKTLLKRVLESSGIEGEQPTLTGEVAVSFGKDPVLPAKKLYEFSKEKKESFKLLGGILENKFLGSDEIVSLAMIPSREILNGKLVNVMYSPVSGFVSVLNNTIGSFVNVIDQIAKSKS